MTIEGERLQELNIDRNNIERDRSEISCYDLIIHFPNIAIYVGGWFGCDYCSNRLSRKNNPMVEEEAKHTVFVKEASPHDDSENDTSIIHRGSKRSREINCNASYIEKTEGLISSLAPPYQLKQDFLERISWHQSLLQLI